MCRHVHTHILMQHMQSSPFICYWNYTWPLLMYAAAPSSGQTQQNKCWSNFFSSAVLHREVSLWSVTCTPPLVDIVMGAELLFDDSHYASVSQSGRKYLVVYFIVKLNGLGKCFLFFLKNTVQLRFKNAFHHRF